MDKRRAGVAVRFTAIGVLGLAASQFPVQPRVHMVLLRGVRGAVVAAGGGAAPRRNPVGFALAGSAMTAGLPGRRQPAKLACLPLVPLCRVSLGMVARVGLFLHAPEIQGAFAGRVRADCGVLRRAEPVF